MKSDPKTTKTEFSELIRELSGNETSTVLYLLAKQLIKYVVVGSKLLSRGRACVCSDHDPTV